jgi:phosphoribosylglycinamide formyltransferase 1
MPDPRLEQPRNPPITEPPIRLSICVSGGGTTLQNLIDRIEDGRLRASIGSVVASKIGIKAIDRAIAASLPFFVPETSPKDVHQFSEQVFGAIRRSNADLVVLAGFLALIEIPEDYRNRVINIHPSLIPAFSGKGFHGERVHSAAIDRGVKITGCTVHFVDEAYDTGPIILQRTVPVFAEDSPQILAARVFNAECEAVPEAVELYAAGRLEIRGRRVHVCGQGDRRAYSSEKRPEPL